MKEIKKPSPVNLTVRFIVGILIILVIFGTFFNLKYNYPIFNNWCFKLGIHTNTISAFLTALAFVGFLIISQYPARCNHITELKMLAEKGKNTQEIEVEKEKNKRFQYDSLRLTMQIARLNSFTNATNAFTDKEKYKENEYCRRAALKEIEDFWVEFEKRFNKEPKTK